MTLVAMVMVVGLAAFGFALAAHEGQDARIGAHRASLNTPAAMELQDKVGAYAQLRQANANPMQQTQGSTANPQGAVGAAGATTGATGDTSAGAAGSTGATDESATGSSADAPSDGAEGEPDVTGDTSAPAQEASPDEGQAVSAEAEDAAGTEQPQAAQAGTLETTIATADGKHYTVRVEYGADADIPAGAELAVVQVIQTPEGYDRDKPEFKDRPAKTEKFASADDMKARSARLAEALDVQKGDITFYEEFLDIAIKANGADVKPAAPVTVTVETDAVAEEVSDKLRASFFTDIRPGAQHAYALALADRSAEPEKDKKYGKGVKLTFAADKISELGLAGIIVPDPEKADGEGAVEAVVAAERALSEQSAEADGGDEASPKDDASLATLLAAGPDAHDAGFSPALAAKRLRLAQVMQTAGVDEDESDQATYTVTWADDDGTVFKVETLAAGALSTPPNDPVKPADAQYTYTFAGWSPEPKPITEDVTYTATYDQTVNTYTITWVNYDGSPLETDNDVAYGTAPEYNGLVPERPEDSSGQYTFSYWDPNPEPVTGNATYTATFTSAPVEFCIQDQRSHQPIAGVRFELVNSANITVWVSDATTANGVASIPRVESEVANGGGAVFAPNSSYTLKQTQTDDDHMLPQGTWTLTVDAQGKFHCVRNAAAGGLSTLAPSTEEALGIRFYLYNVAASSITYDYNYPAGVQGQPEDKTFRLPFLAYDGSYTVETDDPFIDGYEFVGWEVDNTSRVAKMGDVLSLDTVNVSEHIMLAAWRSPLNVNALVYEGGASDDARVVEPSEGTYLLAEEASLTFGSLEAVCTAYGNQNQAVKDLNNSSEYSFAFATVTLASGDSQRIEALRYDSDAHVWQYRLQGGAGWANIGQNDLLNLYYTSNLVSVRWVREAEDGTLSALDESRFPKRTVAVGADWASADELIGANDRPVVSGNCYYRYLGFGEEDATQSSDLSASGLQSLSLRNTETGFMFRSGDSGDGEALSGSTMYLVYSETPPEGSAYLDIENLSNFTYRIDSLYVGGETAADDLVAQDRVVLVGDVLQVVSAQDTVASAKTAQLVLLRAGAKPFVLDGGFVEDAETGTVVSAAVVNPGKAVRTALTKSEGENDLQNTAGVTRGTLENDPAKVAVTFDSDLFDLTVKKEWSDDSYPEHYEVDLALLEDGKACATPEANASGLYTVRPDDWAVVIANLPKRNAYAVAEQAVRRVQGNRTTADETGNFQATSSAVDENGTITVGNTRSNAVCQVGDQQFTTVKAAVDYIGQNGKVGTIEMLADYIMAESGAVVVPEGYDIRLTTVSGENAKTITRGFAGTSDMFLVQGSLTLADVVLNGRLDGTILAKDGNGGLVTVSGANGILKAESGSVLTYGQASNGSAIYAADGATVRLNGARITANRATNGGAVGVESDACAIELSGDTYVYGNGVANGSGQYNVYLDQDSSQVIRIVEGGLGDNANVGVYVPNGEGSAQYNAHGAPAKPFAFYDAQTKDNLASANLDKLVNDRLSAGASKYGASSDVLENTVVWGETFEFTVTVQWLDEHLNVTEPPADAQVDLRLNGGTVTPAEGVATTVTRSAATGWECTFTGLAKYDGSGNAYQYYITEANLPADFKQIIFTGDKATQDNRLTYDGTDTTQLVTVSNYYRYTTFTVVKNVEPADQGLNSRFALYGVPKTGADLSNGTIRKGGVGGVHDLPASLRGSVSEADSIPTDNLFHTDGANRWYVAVGGSVVKFHAFYDYELGEFAGSVVEGPQLVSGEAWQAGDVIRTDDGGSCSVYGNDAKWHRLSTRAEVSYIQFSRQDGNGGVEGVGGQSMGKSCTIVGSGAYEFTLDAKLSSDYYYYAVETSVQETNGQNRSIGTSHKLVATYDPQYQYDQLAQSEVVTNTRQDYLSVDKVWPDDATTFGTCVFDVYKVVDASGGTMAYLAQQANFKNLVTASTFNSLLEQGKVEKVGEFSLPDPDTGSWVHVLKDDAYANASDTVYMVRERSAGGVAIVNPSITDSSTAVDAVYAYDEKVNQITVHNLSEVLCKVVDDDGAEHPFRTLNDALTYGRTRSGDAGSNTDFTIYMLRDYSIPASDSMSLAASENIVLTTATSGQLQYMSSVDGKVKATITRKSDNKLPFVMVTGDAGNSSATSFTLENIELDGAEGALGGQLNRVAYNDGGFVYARNATVVVRASGADGTGVELRNGKASNGGAIYAESSIVSVSDAMFDNCQSTSTDGTYDKGGGAIWTSGVSTTVTDTTFTKCVTPRSGGAIAAMYQSTAGGDGETTTIEGCTFVDCRATGSHGGAVYTRNARLSLGGEGARACSFTSCTAGRRGGAVTHDNMTVGSVTNAYNCTFTDCTTTGGDDGKTNYHGGAGLNTVADTLNATNLTFEDDVAYVRGGGLLHANVNASASNVLGCTFNGCQSRTSGGGGMGLASLNQRVAYCAFTDCSALNSAGGGIDVICWEIDKDALVENCVFTRCESNGGANGGGICFGGRSLTVRGSAFDECKSNNQHGGAISVSAGASMEELVVDSCTFNACTAPNNQGGAIFTNGKVLRAQDSMFISCQAKSTGGAIHQGLGGNVPLEGSSVELTRCTFEGCASLNSNGGALWANALTLVVTGEEGVTTFRDCSSYGDGGALRHERANVDAQTTLSACTFQGCKSVNSAGGAVWTRSTVLDVANSAFADCGSRSTGGAIYHQLGNNDQIPLSSVDIRATTFANCSTQVASSGAVYSNAQTMTVAGEPGVTTFKDCVSGQGHGGAVYHDRNTEASSTTLTDCAFDGCTAARTDNSNDARGGALCTWATTLSVRDSSFANATSRGDGGSICHAPNGSYPSASSATIVNCSFNASKSERASGGALYTTASALDLEGDSFEGCSSNSHGGAVYQALSKGEQVAYSYAKVTGSTFADCHTATNSGGALYTNALTLTVGGQPGKVTFEGCASYSDGGGAIRHDRNAAASALTLAGCSFKATESKNGSGGAVWTRATKVTVEDASFDGCNARYTGGALFHELNNNDQVPTSDVTITGSTFADSHAADNSGGALYTNALTLTVGGQPGKVTFEDCTSYSDGGGAIRHNRNAAASALTLAGCSFKATESKNSSGGAVWTRATKVTVEDASFDGCTARNSGGALFHELNSNDQISTSGLDVKGSSFQNCTAQYNRGGAIYDNSLVLNLGAPSAGVSFLNCSAAYDGGAVFSNRNSENSQMALSYCSFNLCTSSYPEKNESRGGAVYAQVRNLVVDGSSFDTCVAKSNGGALYHNPAVNVAGTTTTVTASSFTNSKSLSGNGGALYVEWSQLVMADSTASGNDAVNGGGVYFSGNGTKNATFDSSGLSDNNATNCGGAVYFGSNNAITLRNGTSITGNSIANTTVNNAAGIYLNIANDKSVLVLGSEGIEDDTITVYDNTTSAGAQSNLLLMRGGWDNKAQRYKNRADAVSLLSNLAKPGTGATGTIGVCNPGTEGSQFGLGNVGNHTGANHIVSDIDTLYGVIDPADHEGKIVIWYAPPVCKITDQNGWPVTYDGGKTAVFSTLKAAIEAVNVTNSDYLKDRNDVAPSQVQIQMLVPDYTIPEGMPVLRRSITLTTAAAGPGKHDYPLDATSPHSTVTRGDNAAGPMLTVGSGVSLTVSGITLDGGDREAKPHVVASNGGIIYGQADASVTLGANAVLQNSAVSSFNNGGAVYVTGGTNPNVPAFVMDMNATIKGCSAGNGGGVYLTGGALFEMNDAPHIEGCSASRAGGAVYVSPYATMSFASNPNGVIRDNFVTSMAGEGAGIYLANNASKLNLRLGAAAVISGNYVQGSEDATRLNGGDPYPVIFQDIYLGESASPITSLMLTGNLSLPEGSIWVWARSADHYKSEMQFAVVQANSQGVPTFQLNDSSLAVFRNARDDADSENETDMYLYGMQEDGVNVIWSYVTGSSPIVLRKVVPSGASYDSLAGATFTVYKGRSANAYVVRHEDGTRETLANLTSRENGTIWVGTLSYGTYYLHETSAPSGYVANRWFKLTVDENGLSMSDAASSRAALG